VDDAHQCELAIIGRRSGRHGGGGAGSDLVRYHRAGRAAGTWRADLSRNRNGYASATDDLRILGEEYAEGAALAHRSVRRWPRMNLTSTVWQALEDGRIGVSCGGVAHMVSAPAHPVRHRRDGTSGADPGLDLAWRDGAVPRRRC